MEIGNNEMMKLFDFILENKNIIIADNGLFSRDTLVMIRAIVKGKIPNDFQLTKEQKQLIINSFINSNNIFTEDTPNFIIENEECIRVAIARSLNSINFIETSNPNLQAYIISEALKQRFVLRKNSPNFLKSNYNVALNSIKLDAASADFINWSSMKGDELDNLINEAINNNYELSNKSNIFLKENIKMVLESIKKDKENIKYAGESAKSHPEVFKYLLLNGYSYGNGYLRKRTLNQILDSDVLGYCFKQLNVYGNSNEEYIARFNKIFSDAIKSCPSIHTFESVFQTVAEAEWRNYRNSYIDDYENIFGKICTQLRNYDDFDYSLRNLSFLKNMKSTLADKYDDIYNAMQEYFNIFHSNTTKKLEKIQPYQDVIAKLSALYISKCKENYKKNELEEYYEWIREYFTLRMDHPIVNKKVIQSQKKKVFRDLYRNKDEEICNFLNNIAQSYSEYADNKIIWKMINGFVVDSYSKTGDIFRIPYNYDNYERYEKALKLINRLNSGYIQYDGIEVSNYKDIIKYDETTKKYVYTGDTFDVDDLKAYNDFREKAKLFEEIKKDIILKVRTMEIDVEIDDDILEELTLELPFTDEYFEFDKEYLEWFDLSKLCKTCMNDSYDFGIENFTDDESFANLYNLLINNGIVWLLLFMDRDHNVTLKNNGINVDDIRNLINNMKNMSDLSKKFVFDTTKYDELLILNDISRCADAKAIAILGKEIIEKLYKFKDYTNEDAEKIISMAKEFVCQMVKRSKSTVPFVNGETMNYKYSVYDSQDESVLLAGINTDACFRIDGNDNDFLHYCALDKNGLVIKITDSFGNFIARAGGFRNGNCVFFNQLRTIYDEGGNIYNGNYENEKNDIIETFKKACEDIVSTSHHNPYEIDKIDYVFVTRSYSLCCFDSNVPEDVTEKIGDEPMDNDSEDWKNFVYNTENLQESEDDGAFTTDYGDYSLICMASFKRRGTLKPRDIKPKNVEPVYERTRNHIMATEKPDITIFKKINKINGIKSYLDDEKFEMILIPEESAVFTGDNWYIIFQNGSIISSCVLDFDKKAKIEFEVTRATINQHVISQQQFSLDQVVETLQSQNLDDGVKILKLHL